MSRFELCKFVPAPDPELVCGICMNVLDTPHETPCRHVFCRECILTALKETQKCPVCRAPCSEKQSKEVLPLVQNLINKLTMKCDNFDNGCTDFILKEFFLDHLQSCDYAMVQCQYKSCGQFLLRKDCKEHESNSCAYRDRMCEGGCGLMILLDDISSHNCVQALVRLVKDLTDKNLELQKRIAELETSITMAKPKSSAATAAGDHGDQNSLGFNSTISENSNSDHSHTGSSSISSHSWATYDAIDELSDLSDWEYDSYGTDQSRSSQTSVSSPGSQSARSFDNFNVSARSSIDVNVNSNHSEDNNVNRRLDIVENVNENDSDGIPEYQVIEVSSDGICQNQSSNACVGDNIAHIELPPETAGENSVPPVIVDCLSDASSSKTTTECSSASTGKRRLEDDIGFSDNTGRTALKRIKQCQSQEQKDVHTEETIISGSLPTNNTSSTELLVGSRKHPHKHKKTQSESQSSVTLNSDLSLSVGGETGTALSSTDSTQTSQIVHPLADSIDSMITVNDGVGTRNNRNTSRRGPVTRSRGQSRHVALEDNAIPNVRVPPSVAYLLSKYAQEDGSSDDESWSPSHGI